MENKNNPTLRKQKKENNIANKLKFMTDTVRNSATDSYKLYQNKVRRSTIFNTSQMIKPNDVRKLDRKYRGR